MEGGHSVLFVCLGGVCVCFSRCNRKRADTSNRKTCQSTNGRVTVLKERLSGKTCRLGWGYRGRGGGRGGEGVGDLMQ